MLETHGVWVAGTGHEGEGEGVKDNTKVFGKCKGKKADQRRGVA